MKSIESCVAHSLSQQIAKLNSRKLIIRYVHPKNMAQIIQLLTDDRITHATANDLINLYIARAVIRQEVRRVRAGTSTIETGTIQI